MRKIFTILSSLVLIFILAKCDYSIWYEDALQHATFSSSVLIKLERGDGESVPRLVDYIEQNYGFRAQRMNIIVPSYTLEISKAIHFEEPELDKIETIVTNWDTVDTDVVNDAKAVDFTFDINGTGYIECRVKDDRCVNRQTMKAFLEVVIPEKVKSGIIENMEILFIGSEGDIVSISPSKVDYNCSVDETKIYDTSTINGNDRFEIQDAVRCTGTVHFNLDQ